MSGASGRVREADRAGVVLPMCLYLYSPLSVSILSPLLSPSLSFTLSVWPLSPSFPFSALLLCSCTFPVRERGGRDAERTTVVPTRAYSKKRRRRRDRMERGRYGRVITRTINSYRKGKMKNENSLVLMIRVMKDYKSSLRLSFLTHFSSEENR